MRKVDNMKSHENYSNVLRNVTLKFIECMLDTDLFDKDKADNAAECIALDLFIIHLINCVDCKVYDYEMQKMEARIFTDGIMNRLIDYIETKESGII